MNLATLSAGYLRARPLQTLLSVTLLSLGVATIVAALLAVSQLEARAGRDLAGIDLVVGAKGSPMQLILSGVYQLDAPTGNIPLEAAQELAKNPLVRKAMPLAMGDSFRGFRIIGCGPEYPQHYGAALRAGRYFEKSMEAVLGAEVAERSGIAVGGRFTGVHGLGGEGEEHPQAYTVVGILAPTGSVIDRLVLTPVQSVWDVHKHEEAEPHHDEGAHGEAPDTDPGEQEVTVLLVQYASPLAAATLPRAINSKSELQAASPALETARLFRIAGTGLEALHAFAIVLIAAAGLSVFIALYSALEERRYDLAVMRVLGASRGRLFALLLAEGLALAALGTLAGVALGHLFASALGAWLVAAGQPAVSGLSFVSGELWLVVAAMVVGLGAALIPAYRAYRTDVSRVLAEG